MTVFAPQKALEKSDLATGDLPDLSLDELHRIVTEQLNRAREAKATGDTHAARNAAQIVSMTTEEYLDKAQQELMELGL